MFIPEDKTSGYMVGCLEAPVNGAPTPTYTITGGDSAPYFTIGTNTGVIEIADNNYWSATYPLTMVVHRVSGILTEDFTVTIDLAGVLLTRKSSVYVDPVNGSNVNDGSMLSPLSSWDLAYDQVDAGGVILLYSGYYGARSVSYKPCTTKGLRNAVVYMESLTIPNGHSIVTENIVFTSTGIDAQASTNISGSATVRGCKFYGTAGISIDTYKYVSIVKNTIASSVNGIVLNRLDEVSVLSNIIYGSVEGIIATQISRIEILHNTLNSITHCLIDDSASNSAYGVVYVTITPLMISSKQLVLPGGGVVSDGFGNPIIAVNLVDTSAQQLSVDFTVAGSIVSWSGLGLETILREGDTLRIQYLYYGTGSNGYTQVDSNSLTNIANLEFTSGENTWFGYNNLFGTTTNALPNATNISADPLYVSAGAGDYSLSNTSPNLLAANPTTLPVINGVAPLQNNQDFVGVNRTYKGQVSDIGAVENLKDVYNHTSPSFYVGQQGYDKVYDGDEDRPFRRSSEAMSQAAGDPILFDIGNTVPNVSDRKMYFDDVSEALGSSIQEVMNPQTSTTYIERKDFVVVQPFDPAAIAGTSVYVSPTGDDTNPGTESEPYRTIEAALLAAATNVIVYAGDYTLYKGETGKNIIYLPKNDFIVLSPFINGSLNQGEWSIVYNSGSTTTFSSNEFTITHP